MSKRERQYLLRVCKHGFPSPYRKHLWLRASGAASYMNLPENRFYYRNLRRAGLDYPSPSSHQIEVDLKRTFSELEMPCDERNIRRLRNVLTAYTKRCPLVSYCQGMNFIVARLLNAVDGMKHDGIRGKSYRETRMS